MREYEQSINNVLDTLETNRNKGLSEIEVNNRRLKYGENKLSEAKKKTSLEKFIDQFKDAMIIILLIAAAVSFGLALHEKDTNAFFEPLLILLIVVLNAIMGVVQENKAERSLEALMSLSSPHARVIRDGIEKVINASDLVVGDIIKLEAGDFVPADARLITSSSLKSEESALTGESVPVEKDASVIIKADAPIGDRINMVYSGCSITYGTAFAVVSAIGMNTEMGKIAGLLNNEEDTKTPLQIKLAELGKKLGFMAIVVCILIFIIGIIDDIPIIEIFMTSVSLAVSAIPEGLPVIVTIVLSLGVGKMAKRNAIVKKLPAVETLGSTSVICSDKTGTLTQNKMTLVKLYTEKEKQIEASRYFRLDESRSFSVHVDSLAKQLNESIDLLIICNPNNPTSTAISRSDMRKILDLCKENGIYVLVDETYVEFAEDLNAITSIPLTQYYNNIIVLRGISKFFAAPGLRLGYAVCGNRDLIKSVVGRQDPWSINTLAAVAGEIMFSDTDYISQTRQLIASERERICKKLDTFKDVNYYEPKANFILVKILNDNVTATDVFEAAIQEKMMIRDCSDFPFLDNKYFRFCIMMPEQNDQLLKVIENLLG